MPFVKGKQVRRYAKVDTNTFILFPYAEDELGNVEVLTEEFIAENYPQSYKYLKSVEKDHRRKDGGSTNDATWYRYARNQGLKFVSKEKISSMEIASGMPHATINNSGFLHPTTVYSWLKNDEIEEPYEYFLGIINSRLMWWFLYNTGDALQGDARRFKTNYLNPYPFPRNPDFERVATITKIVTQILTQKQSDPTADTTSLEAEIDVLVYKLYGLTYAEVLVVDGAFGLSEEEYNVSALPG
jgi:hypothetical protein